MLMPYRSLIPICLGFYTGEVWRFGDRFTCLKYLLICGGVLFLCHCVGKKHDDIIAHQCRIHYNAGTIITCLHKWCAFFTDYIKDNCMDFIKVFFGCIFIGKVDNVQFVFGDQHRPVCAVNNRLIEKSFSGWYTNGNSVKCVGSQYIFTPAWFLSSFLTWYSGSVQFRLMDHYIYLPW